jgi:hypothetical protein
VGSDNVGRFRGSKASQLFASQLAHPTVGGLITGLGCLVGACLQQQLHRKKAWQSLGFFSKKLEADQKKYSAFDKELFSCYL